MENNKTVTVETTVAAPIKKVWQLWTMPEHIIQWNNASDDWHTPHAENDLRVGGKFLSRMEAKDGSFGFEFDGVYSEVVENQRLAYTLDDERKVNITFSSQADGTKIIEVFEPENENPIELQQGGWQAILNNFKKYAETATATPKVQRITPFLWFDNQAEEAARFYTTIFSDSAVVQVTPLVVTFDLCSQRFMAMNGGPMFKFTEAISLFVHCDDQAEVDFYWEKLQADGGSESQCGWLKDKYGLSWQIVPKQLMQFMSDSDTNRSRRVMQAIMLMKKIIVADLEKAYHAAD